MIAFWIVAGIILLFGFVVFFGAPYVPSKRRELEAAFEGLYKLGDKDVLVDIGSGDGIVLRVASRKGAYRAIGYELNPALVFLSRFLSRHDEGVSVYAANLWRAHFPPDTTVVYVFAVTRDIEKVIRKVQLETNRIGRPLSLISYGNKLPHMTELESLGAHHLYTFTPLHVKKT